MRDALFPANGLSKNAYTENLFAIIVVSDKRKQNGLVELDPIDLVDDEEP